jgi:hypothetical protein
MIQIRSRRCCDYCVPLDKGFLCCVNYFRVETYHDFYVIAYGDGEIKFVRKDGLGYIDYTFETLGEVLSKEVVCEDRKLVVKEHDVVSDKLFLRLGREGYMQWFEALERFFQLIKFFRGKRLINGKWYLDEVELDGFEDISKFDKLCEGLRKLELRVIQVKAIYGVENIFELLAKYGREAWQSEALYL